MAIYAIGDPHLSRANPKPMSIFGPAWADHDQRFFKNWAEVIQPDDTVLIVGDISWAMTIDEAFLDLAEIDALPGRKVLIPGNHDYWWSSLRKLRALPLQSIHFLQNDHVLAEETLICGTRGWMVPGDRNFAQDPEHNAKIFAREVGRLRLSLESGVKAHGERPTIVMFHYPPVNDRHEPSDLTRVLAEYPQVTDVVYGHLHGASHHLALQGEFEGINYHLVAGDYLGFWPRRIR